MDFLRGGTPKSKDPRGTLRRLWTYLERQRWVLILTVFVVIATSVLDLLGPFLMGKALDVYISKVDLPGLASAGLVIAACLAICRNVAPNVLDGRHCPACSARLKPPRICKLAAAFL
jgi:ABC-type multidrug transport system fused ATPase/permease subunit